MSNPGEGLRRLPRRWRAGATALAVLMAAALLGGWSLARRSTSSTAFPHSAAMEQQLGVRFSRVAVVGAGGLVTLTYVVLDSDKASRFQADAAHPPELRSQSRARGTSRVSLMKQGHELRSGQTYYLVYENTRSALRPGEKVTIVKGSLRLENAPVL